MILDFLVELIGTFIFLAVIIKSGSFGNIGPFAIGITLATVIYFGGSVSGGHFNPAVTFMFWMDKKVDSAKLVYQIVAQLIGAALAYFFYKFSKK
tara:strand:+ start:2158 stop:2442 length:285 start_codon:yes stop_codon:yes gene_type:complete